MGRETVVVSVGRETVGPILVKKYQTAIVVQLSIHFGKCTYVVRTLHQ